MQSSTCSLKIELAGAGERWFPPLPLTSLIASILGMRTADLRSYLGYFHRCGGDIMDLAGLALVSSARWDCIERGRTVWQRRQG